MPSLFIPSNVDRRAKALQFDGSNSAALADVATLEQDSAARTAETTTLPTMADLTLWDTGADLNAPPPPAETPEQASQASPFTLPSIESLSPWQPKQQTQAIPGSSDEASGARFDRPSATPTFGASADANEVRQYLRQSAAARGIDPNVADQVVQSEGGYSPNRAGDSGSSFGPLQLHYGDVASGGNSVAGMGDDFTRQTGLDARDPANWKAATDFALDHAARNGWGAFHGAARVGIGERQGIGGQPSTPAAMTEPDRVQQRPAGDLTPDQFGSGELSSEEAYAACGPAAAIAFARTQGRNPTLREAVDLAKEVGWTPGAGMAGPASQVELLKRMGVASRLEQGVDVAKIARDVQTGNPVTIDTPGHYFVAERYDPQSGKFDFGKSASVLKAAGGKRWFSLDEIAQLGMGAPRATIFVDSPESPTPSLASGLMGVNDQVGDATGAPEPSSKQKSPFEQFGESVTGAIQGVGSELGKAGNTIGEGLGEAGQRGAQWLNEQSDNLVDTLNAAPGDVIQGARDEASRTAGLGSSPMGSAIRGIGDVTGLDPGAIYNELTQGKGAGPGVGVGREAGGQQQLHEENIVIVRELEALLAKVDSGQPLTTVEQARLQELNDQYNTAVAGGEKDWSGIPKKILEAAARNPSQDRTDTVMGIAQALAATALAPNITGLMGGRTGLARQIPAAALDPGGQVFGGAAETGLRGAGEIIGGVARSPVGDVIGSAARGARDFLGDVGRGMTAPDRPALGLEARGAADAPSDRFYHGTGTAFDTPDPAKFDENGLFGPGYYLTKNPDAAQRYAEQGAWDSNAPGSIDFEKGQVYGANIRAVDVPKNLKLFDATETNPPGRDELLSQGYDGIRFSEEITNRFTPWQSGEALPLKHEALVIFPESLPKIRNALSLRAAGAGITPPADRFYHGTGTAFETTDPAKFDENGLFGPGYYLTSDPRVAGSYAETPRGGIWSADNRLLARDVNELSDKIATTQARLAERIVPMAERRILETNLKTYIEAAARSGPNIRPVDVPRGLRLLDADAPASPEFIQTIKNTLLSEIDQGADRAKWWEPSEIEGALKPDALGLYHGETIPLQNAYVRETMRNYVGDAEVNRMLAAAGYDGVKYSGGQRIPMADDAGKAIEHDAVMVFPESLSKIRNALSGREGGAGIVPPGGAQAAVRGAYGGAAGASSAYISPPTDENGNPLDPSDPRYARAMAGRTAAGFVTAVVGGSKRGRAAIGNVVERVGDELPVRPGIPGAKTWASSVEDAAKRYDFHYEIKSLDDLVTSHNDAFQMDPRFPKDMQPRLRDRAASRDQVNRIASTLQADALQAETHRLDSGPPIIGSDGVVESGNGRTMGMRLARDQYPERWTAYQDGLRARAEEVGIDLAALDKMPDPVLVRVRDTEVNRAAFAAEANQTIVQEMSPYERALQDSGRMTPNLMASLTVGENQSILQALTSASNRPVVRDFMQTIPANERAALMSAGGELNAAGLERMKSALFARTYPGDVGKRLAETFIESIDPGIKNVENALYASLPSMARVEGMIAAGEREASLSLADDLSAAVDVLSRLKQEGMSVKDYLGQASMFERELTPLQEQLLGHLDSMSRAPKQMREFIDRYAAGVESEPHTGATGMFGAPERRSREELLNRAAQHATTEVADAPLFRPVESTPTEFEPIPVRGTAPETPAATPPRDRLEEPGPGAVPETPSGPAGRVPAEPELAPEPAPPAQPVPELRPTPIRKRLTAASQPEGVWTPLRSPAPPRDVPVGTQALPGLEQTTPTPGHVVGYGYIDGVSAESNRVLQNAAERNRQFPRGVPMAAEREIGVLLGLKPAEVKAKWLKQDTRQGAAEIEQLRLGTAAVLNDLQDDIARIRDAPDVSASDKIKAIEKLTTAAELGEYLRAGRRSAESTGRALNQFKHRMVATNARAAFESLDALARNTRTADGILTRIGAGRIISPGDVRQLDAVATQLEGAVAKGNMDRNGASLNELTDRLSPVRTQAERYADPLAIEMQAMETNNKGIDRFIKQLDDRVSGQMARQAIDTKKAEARDIIREIIKNPSDEALRERFRDWTNEMVGNAPAVKGMMRELDTRLDTWAKSFAKEVEKRTTAAEVAAKREADNFMAAVEKRNQTATQKEKDFRTRWINDNYLKETATKLREVAEAARRGPISQDMIDTVERLHADMTGVGLEGAARSQDIRRALTNSGLIRLAGKVTDDRLNEMAALLATVNPDDPASLGRVIGALRQGTWADRIKEFGIVNMLSSPATMGLTGVNTASNIANATATTLIKAPLMATWDTAASAVTGRERSVFYSEIPANLRAIAHSWRPGLDTAVEVMRHGYSNADVQRAAQLADVSHMRPELLSQLPGAWGNVGEGLHMISTRPLQASDTLVGHMLYAGQLAALAERKAKTTGVTVESIMANLADHMDIVDQAGKISDYTLLKGDPGRISKAIAVLRAAETQGGVKGAGAIAADLTMHHLMPFTTTPTNWFKQGIEFSPVGTAVNVGRMVTERNNPVRQAELAANVAAGTGLFLMANYLINEGNLTGDGPSDPEKRQMLMDQGWQQRSIRIGGRWFSYDSTPVAIPFGMVATAREAYKEAVDKGLTKGSVNDFVAIMTAGAAGAVRGSLKSLVNQSMFRGVGEVYRAISDERANPTGAIAQQFTRYIPAGGMINYLSSIGDGYLRQPETVPERIQARTPLRGPLPPRQDVLGRPVPNPVANPVSALFPFPRNVAERPEPVIQAFQQAGTDLSKKPPTDVPYPGVPGTKVPLNREEQSAYLTAFGDALQQAFSRYASGGRVLSKDQLEFLKRRANDTAQQKILQQIGIQEIRSRVQKQPAGVR